MTTQELHIELDLLCQKISSHWNTNFLPQHIDSIINKEIDKFLKQRISRKSNPKQDGIYDTIKRLQDTNSLTKTISLPVEVINNEKIVVLPHDCFFYISSEVGIKCNKDLNLDTKTRCRSEFPIFPSIVTDGEIDYSKLTELSIYININGINYLLYDFSEIPDNYFPSQTSAVNNIDFIYTNSLINIIQKKIKIYSEEVDDFNYVHAYYDKFKNVIVIESIKEFYLSSTRTYDDETSPIIINNKSSTYKQYDIDNPLITPVDIIDEEFQYTIKNSSLSSSNMERIKAILRDTKITLQSPKDFVFNTITITYLCKPSKIDLLLNHNSELPDSVLIEIIDNCARVIKAIISSDTYDKFATENLIIE